MEDLRRSNTFDFSLFLSALLLWGAGLALVHSATLIHQTGPLASAFRNQVIWVVMGVVLLLLVVSIPSRMYYSFAYIIYAGALVLLIYALVGGVVSKGATRWVSLGGFRVQPSEFAKVGLLFALARGLSDRGVSLERPVSFLLPAGLIGLPFLLVLKQPDLGTAMVFSAMALPMLYWAGLPLHEVFFLTTPVISVVLSAIPLIASFASHTAPGFMSAVPWGLFFVAVCVVLYVTRPSLYIVVAVVALSIAAATVTNVLWNDVLKDYQKARVFTFIDPLSDPAGAGYQVIQSKVAIGSGHIFGKGYLQGTQTRLSFLPEQHTDFIFSVLGEQFGLLGCTLILMLFLFLLVKGFLTTQYVRNRFSNLLVVGSVSILAFHIFVNVAMTLGMFPVTGVPLPFLSYGGSFAVTVAILVGLLINVRASSQDF
jgi:rod shape determining protein RodA